MKAKVTMTQDDLMVAQYDWRPQCYGKSFTGLVEEIVPGVTREEFERKLREYLREFLGGKLFPHLLNKDLLDDLFRVTCYFLQTHQAVTQMRAEFRGRDWKTRTRVLRKLLKKDIPPFRKRLAGYRNPKLKRTDAVVGSVLARVKEIERELQTIREFQKNDELLVQGHIKPDIASQFMMEVEEYYLARRHPSWKRGECRLLMRGCLAAVDWVFKKGGEDTFERIPMRINRAKKSANRAAAEPGGWCSYYTVALPRK